MTRSRCDPMPPTPHLSRLDEFLMGLLPDPVEEGENCSKPRLVPLEGLDSPTEPPENRAIAG